MYIVYCTMCNAHKYNTNTLTVERKRITSRVMSYMVMRVPHGDCSYIYIIMLTTNGS